MTSLGVAPYGPDMRAAADRRRLGCWARARQIRLELNRPERCENVAINPLSDLSYWNKWKSDKPTRRLLFDFVDFRYVRAAIEGTRSTHQMVMEFGRNFTYGRGMSRFPFPSYTSRIAQTLSLADQITCGSVEQAEALHALGVNALDILDCHEEVSTADVRDGQEVSRSDRQPSLHLIWEGQLATLEYFPEIRGALEAICQRLSVHVTFCTQLTGFAYANRFKRITPNVILRGISSIPNLSWSVVPWSPEALAREALDADVAVVPVSLSCRDAYLKPENRLMTFWRLGLPTVASATPAHTRVFTTAGAEGIARSQDDWIRLLLMARNSSWRTSQAHLCREYARIHASPELLHSKWDSILGIWLD